jgi:hypothetical protein
MRQQHITVSPMLVPPHAAAKLVQVGQAEPVGVVDEHGVGARHVETRLDDGRRDQDVDLAGEEAEHAVLELVLVHLAVAVFHAGLGHDLPHAVGHLADGADAVMDEEDLAVAGEFPQDGLADAGVVPRADLGAHGPAVLRGGRQAGDVADAKERHM